jgi:Ca2+/H+ antiporter, TMEM165/GDT1 family
MTTSTVVLALAVFGASAVEMVEALTIVVAAGVTRGWRSALEGSGAAVLVLSVLVVAVGIPLARLVPINVLRVVIGALLLVLGLDWLRKAVLRASGHKALHDEDAIYARTVEELSASDAPVSVKQARGPAMALKSPSPRPRGPRDATGFAVAFKGVFLEGMEVVLIVITLGASSGHLALAAASAAVAATVVALVGLVVARQLSAIPENSMKLAVGVMLTSFGVFWVGEGAGIRWPGRDAMILVLIAVFAGAAALLSVWMRRIGPSRRDSTLQSGAV